MRFASSAWPHEAGRRCATATSPMQPPASATPSSCGGATPLPTSPTSCSQKPIGFGSTEMRIATIEARIDADLALGRHADLVAELEHLVAEHPVREHLRAQLMLALSRSGRQTEALRSYESARSVLADEVGLEPSPELRALETAILRQDDTTVRREAEPNPSPRRARLRTPLTSLVGRRDLLDALAARLRRRPPRHAWSVRAASGRRGWRSRRHERCSRPISWRCGSSSSPM